MQEVCIGTRGMSWSAVVEVLSVAISFPFLNPPFSHRMCLLLRVLIESRRFGVLYPVPLASMRVSPPFIPSLLFTPV